MSSRLFAPLVLLLSIAAIAGCASDRPPRLLAKTIAPAADSEIAGSHEIFIATNRARTEAPGQLFNGRRAPEAAYAKVEVTVPATHTAGEVELAPNPAVADPARYFAARKAALYPEESTFEAALAKDIAAHGGRALVFIHGYNTGFDEAVYRATQIFHDSDYTGTPVLFSWPSAGRAVGYVYDNNSATTARDALEETLRLLARAGAKQIDIVAHSMGNWVTMETLRQLAIQNDRDLGGRITDVVLASPDLDVDVFKSQMRRYGVPDQPFVLLTSRNDRALTVSGFIAGNQPRVGGYEDSEELASLGVVVVDVTDVDGGDWLNHTKFAANPILIQLLGERLARTGTGELDGTPTPASVGHMESLVRGIGQTVGSAADIIITTPFEVLELATTGQ